MPHKRRVFLWKRRGRLSRFGRGVRINKQCQRIREWAFFFLILGQPTRLIGCRRSPKTRGLNEPVIFRESGIAGYWLSTTRGSLSELNGRTNLAFHLWIQSISDACLGWFRFVVIARTVKVNSLLLGLWRWIPFVMTVKVNSLWVNMLTVSLTSHANFALACGFRLVWSVDRTITLSHSKYAKYSCNQHSICAESAVNLRFSTPCKLKRVTGMNNQANNVRKSPTRT